MFFLGLGQYSPVRTGPKIDVFHEAFYQFIKSYVELEFSTCEVILNASLACDEDFNGGFNQWGFLPPVSLMRKPVRQTSWQWFDIPWKTLHEFIKPYFGAWNWHRWLKKISKRYLNIQKGLQKCEEKQSQPWRKGYIKGLKKIESGPPKYKLCCLVFAEVFFTKKKLKSTFFDGGFLNILLLYFFLLFILLFIFKTLTILLKVKF